MAREGQVSVQGLGRGVLLPACCEARVKPGRAQLKPEPVAGIVTPAVALASTASTVAHGDKALESTTKYDSPPPVVTPADWSYSLRRG